MEKIKIAKIVNAVGLKGEVKVYNYSDDRERFEKLEEVIVSGKTESVSKILGVRYQGNMVILKLEGVSDRNAAELLRGKLLYLPEGKSINLGEDTYFVDRLKGLRVVDTEGKELGVLTEVHSRSTQDLYEVRKPDGSSFLMPAVKAFVRNIDTENSIMTVDLPEGLADL